LTLLDKHLQATRTKNKKWRQATTQKTGRHRKAIRVGKFKNNKNE
jgi:hypothetical protein